MSHIDEKAFAALLRQQADELRDLNKVTQDDVAPVELDQVSVGRLSRMDALQQQAMSEETRRRRVRALPAIDAALDRMAQGEYGYCQECGEEIPEARLLLDPATAFCVDHAQS